MFRNMRPVILFDVFLNLSFKMTTSFANVARTTANTKQIYILGKISNYQQLGLDMKKLA